MDDVMTLTGRSLSNWGGVGFLGAISLALVGCDFSVTNPGPIQDEFLADPVARGALVASAEKALSFGLAYTANRGAVISGELVASGLTGGAGAGVPVGVPALIRQGRLTGEQDAGNQEWAQSQRARWIAEDMLRRLEGMLSPQEFTSSADVARVQLFVAYTNRVLGENMCDAVIDGGPRQEHTVFLDRARSAFTAAIETANRAGRTDLYTAGLAGRASALAWLGDWDGALRDALLVPTNFEHVAVYHTADESQYNRMAFSTGRQWRAMSVWNTYFEDYYLASGDPRVRWQNDPQFPFGTPAPEGNVRYLRQMKQPNLNSPVRLSSGREMRLLEAEAFLAAGQWQAATEVINQLRTVLTSDFTGEALTGWTVGGLEEGWAALQRERGIELWLEGRRLGDLRRWAAGGRPSAGLPDMSGRATCFPIGETERQTNSSL